jgi:hypothetical protein
MMAATVLKSPELVLEKGEADALANAIAEVEKHYSISLSPETRAWLGLATTAAMIYGPRAYLIAKRRKRDAPPKSQPAKPATPLPTPEPAPSGEGGPKPGGPLTSADFGF